MLVSTCVSLCVCVCMERVILKMKTTKSYLFFKKAELIFWRPQIYVDRNREQVKNVLNHLMKIISNFLKSHSKVSPHDTFPNYISKTSLIT